jgi:hypothetical protein
MNKKEKDFLTRLPETITIYRVMTKSELDSKDFGILWILKKDISTFIAEKYHRNYFTNHIKKVVHKFILNKSEMIAFFNEREEFEIIFIYLFRQLWQQ